MLGIQKVPEISLMLRKYIATLFIEFISLSQLRLTVRYWPRMYSLLAIDPHTSLVRVGRLL